MFLVARVHISLVFSSIFILSGIYIILFVSFIDVIYILLLVSYIGFKVKDL